MTEDTLQYIIHFLLGEDLSEELVGKIGYTSDRNQYDRYSLVIVPSGFFDEQIYGHPESIPQLPLPEIEGIPFLFGTGQTELIGHTQVIYADLIASTYFLITRYEETIRRHTRDAHGRFPGKESLSYRGGFLHRPIIDEYRKLLRHRLKLSQIEIPDIKEQIRKIYLTHDVDVPFLYRGWKGVIRSLRNGRDIFSSLKGIFSSPETDPYYTFPWIFQQKNILEKNLGKERCQTVLFMKGGGNTQPDKPVYNLRSADIQFLIKEASIQHIQIGLHSSYHSGIHPEEIAKEKKNLETSLGRTIFFNRHHYLTLREPEDTDQLEAAGITDDFTMGYADIPGFRLGTCYPVRCINPTTRLLSTLRLHPQIIMDGSLNESQYMGLNYEEAKAYCTELINQINHVGGELVLLWHNISFCKNAPNYHRKLYPYLLNKLATL